MTPTRRRLSISSLSSVAYGCVKLGLGVTVAAGAVAYAAVQVYRGPHALDEDDFTTTHDANDMKTKTNGVSRADETTEAHTVENTNDIADDPNEHSHNASEHSASTPEPEPTPPDSPLPETPIDMVHRDDSKVEQNQKSPSPPLPRHRRKVSFAPIPETEEATFTSEPIAVIQVEPIATVKPPPPMTEAIATQTAPTKTVKKNKKKSQKKKKTSAQTNSTHAQNTVVSS